MSDVGHFVMIEDAKTFNRLLEAAVHKMLEPAAGKTAIDDGGGIDFH